MRTKIATHQWQQVELTQCQSGGFGTKHPRRQPCAYHAWKAKELTVFYFGFLATLESGEF